MEHLIALDIGTQGIKGMLFDRSLNPVRSAFEASRLISPAPGTIWQEPDDLFGSAVRVVRELLDGFSGEIAALAVDSQMAGIMGVGPDGEATTPYDSWLDTRCAAEADEMRALAGREITEITGGPVTTTHGPKILWWKRNHPKAFERTAAFVLPAGYVVGKMAEFGGEAFFDYTGLQYSGFGDNRNKCWSDELLGRFDIPKDKMARIVSPFEVVGRVGKTFSALTGLREGVPIAAGAGDTACSIFGTGGLEVGMLLDCAGSASVLCGLTDHYAPDVDCQTVTMMRSPEDGIYYPLAYVNGGGLTLRWLRDHFSGGKSYAELEGEAWDLPPGSEGLIFTPHFAGRVLPSDARARGSFFGLDLRHRPAHLFRAEMEGIAYEYAYYRSVLRALYPELTFDRMISVGGGAKSELFLKIKADVLGISTLSYESGDSALIGGAVIAGRSVGLFGDDYRSLIDRLSEKQFEIAADRANHEAYRAYAAAYLEAVEAAGAICAKLP